MRKKASFPSREKWQPPLPISPDDKELLHGPKDVLIHKKHYEEMANTKRLVLFTSEGETSTSRTVCLYVQITSDSVRLGRILKIYHEFAGTVYHLARVSGQVH